MATTILNLKGEATLLPRVIKLSWKNPTDPAFVEVAVHRRMDDFQVDPLNPFGVEVYRGTATEIYDYHLSLPAKTKLTDVPDVYDIIKLGNGNESQFLQGESLYYYTVFAVDSEGNYSANQATMTVVKPIKEYFMGQFMYDSLPEIYRIEDTLGDTKRFMELLGYMADYIFSQTHMITDLIDVDRCSADQLPYIAEGIGWQLDKTLPVTLQRQSLKFAVRSYRMAGTKGGLDRLVKYYSGFPQSSGVIETFAFDFYTVSFGTLPESSPRYTTNTTPDFADESIDFDHPKSVDDPIRYTPDFSYLAGTGTTDSKFFVYIQPTYTLTEQEKTQIEARVRRIVDQFKPIRVDYQIDFYDV
jgi:phage tail-like protein